MPADTLDFIRSRAVNDGGKLTVSFSVCREVARAGSLTARDAETLALDNGICPLRYEGNIGTLGLAGQARLLRSRAAVVGCGGLGGWIIEMLARVGVGELFLFDGDVFDESNLNRQILASEENLGMNKAKVAAKRVKAINDAITVRAYPQYLNGANALKLLNGCCVAVDALDNNNSRREVFKACRELNIPFVHGAVGGFFAQAGVYYPGDSPLWNAEDALNNGIEVETGNPSFTPPFAASLQAAETVKILARLDGQLRGELLWFDLKRHGRQIIKIRGKIN